MLICILLLNVTLQINTHFDLKNLSLSCITWRLQILFPSSSCFLLLDFKSFCYKRHFKCSGIYFEVGTGAKHYTKEQHSLLLNFFFSFLQVDWTSSSCLAWPFLWPALALAEEKATMMPTWRDVMNMAINQLQCHCVFTSYYLTISLSFLVLICLLIKCFTLMQLIWWKIFWDENLLKTKSNSGNMKEIGCKIWNVRWFYWVSILYLHWDVYIEGQRKKSMFWQLPFCKNYFAISFSGILILFFFFNHFW